MKNSKELVNHLNNENIRLNDGIFDKNEVQFIKDSISSRQYKGIIVYPHVVFWEPLQTPQQLLRAFAQMGWLCFFCESPWLEDFEYKEIENNVFIIHEKEFLQVIGDNEVIVLFTWMGSWSFLEKIKNKKIWYHILDHLEIFSYYGDDYLSLHKKTLEEADIISYVATPLLKWVGKRKDDAIYLPNGVYVDEFLNIHEGYIPEDIKNIVLGGKKIIGYYGYIAEWMDYSLVRSIALERPDYDFVFIGKTIYDISLVQNIRNIHFLGLKKYNELSDYAKFFDVAIIPFVIDEKMDCVSPIKFYEYCALGLPSVISSMKDMYQYENDFIRIVKTKKEYLIAIDELVEKTYKDMAKFNAPEIANKNSWLLRAYTIEQSF